MIGKFKTWTPSCTKTGNAHFTINCTETFLEVRGEEKSSLDQNRYLNVYICKIEMDKRKFNEQVVLDLRP